MHNLHRFLSEFGAWDFSGDVAYFKLAFLIYAAAWVVYLVHLFAHDRATAGIATGLIVVGLGLHTVSIVIRAVQSGELPSISLYEMVSTTIWGILVLYFITQTLSRITVLGAFVMPVALAMMAYAMFLTKTSREIPPVLHSFWLYIHVPIAVVAYGSLAVVFGLAFAYLFRDGRDNLVWIGMGSILVLMGLGMAVGKRSVGAAAVLGIIGLIPLAIGLVMTRSGAATGESRRGKFWLERLPPLKEMDAIMSRLIALGFVTLTLVIVTGAVWAADAWGRPWGWDPKEVASLIPWLFYAVYLHMRHIAGWRGLPAVLLLFFGYIGVIFCLILINLLPTGLHGYAG